MVLGVAADIRRNLGTIKEKVSEKLAADGLESARHFIESVIRGVSVGAHGLTKDALFRIKTHLVDLIPRKMVDDGQSRGGMDGEEEMKENDRPTQKEEEGGSKAAPYLSPMSSLFRSFVKPLSSRL